ncbi:MAG: flagellar hook-associated protein FlgK, partial [Pseudomonadota bacterium]
GRRELATSARITNGVSVDGVVRVVNDAVISERLLADASAGFDRETVAFFEAWERALGPVDDPLSLPGRVGTFSAALIEAAARPDSQARLSGVLNAAEGVVEGFRRASDEIQTIREAADAQIARDVQRLNTGIQNINDINTAILRSQSAGLDPSALLDQRQQAIDAISNIVPIKTLPRDNGTIALFTLSGAVLLDTTPAVIGFEPRGVITPDMSVQSGALSGLTINGFEVATSGANAPLSGGSLAANFAVRDDLAVTAQSRLDAVARDLIERFQDPAVDPTLAAADAGLFTDGGLAFDPINEAGLARRLEINALADPANGGELWRLRDGLGATAQGPVGDNSILSSLGDALEALRVPASGDVATTARSAGALAADLVSLVAVDRLAAETQQTYSMSRQESLRDLELAQGVDTDQELQKLLLIEQAYAANARVMTAASEMIDRLLAI